MGNTSRGLGIPLIFIFICIFLVSMADGGNLTRASCSEHERLALLKFKHSVTDHIGMLSSWGIGNDCCRWERVGCDDVTGKVVSLHLRKIFREGYADYLVDRDWDSILADYMQVDVNDGAYLVGDEVNSCLTELVNLKHLDLSGNDFQRSRIPMFIGSLKQLRYLDLSSAGFFGNIPHQIENLSNLEVLDLSSDYTQELTTHDLTWIYGLTKLVHLDLSGIPLTRTQNLGHLFYTIPSLLKLRLSQCRLSTAHLGSLHLNSSRELFSIKHLDLSENDFIGQLPSLFMNITSLTFLDVSRNDLGVAWRLENLLNMIPYVLELRLSSCSIQNINLSHINLNFSMHSNIQHLDLSRNEIDGGFPSFLTNMSSLLSVDLSINSLDSPIHVMPNLRKLDISWNEFTQIEDVGIWRHCHLKELIVSSNFIRGEMIGPSTNISKCSQSALEILYLDLNALNCSIPESLGRLTSLRGLDLSRNELIGPIPEAMGKLRTLQELYLSFNQLTGPIPEFHGQLTILHLASNQLTGPIPEFHGQLTILHLASNQLSGSIPESLGRLTSLTVVFLKSNGFTGHIPVSIGRLTSLKVFSVSSNLLTGTIPNSIGQLTNLHILDISNNSLQGVVSEDHFASLSMLKYLDASLNNNFLFNISREWMPPFQLNIARLGSCKIEGGFPQWIQNQRKLDELVLSNASISGPLPTWLRLLPIIRILDLSHNKLTGSLTNLPSVYEVRSEVAGGLLLRNNLFKGLIPGQLCTRTDLICLDISRNRLNGKIPKCLMNMSLEVMVLSSNTLSGIIPSPLGRNPSLELLQLNDNNFNGELHQDLRYFINLEVLDLGENKISGNVPEWIGEKLTYLYALRLHNNNFTGKIPHSLCKSQYLQILDLARNNLSGSIPRCFGELNGMKKVLHPYSYFSSYGYGIMTQVLKGIAIEYTKNLQFLINMDLSSNELVGEIPQELMSLELLIGLNLSYNHFSGGIPKNVGSMKSLNSLDLSVNELTGMIPPSMAALNFLSYLNLSHNNLSGQIPTGNQLQTLTDPSIYANNTFLCGAPLPKECYPHEKPTTTTSKKKYENVNEPNKLWFYLDIACGFATGFWGIIGVLVLNKQWRHKLFMFGGVAMDKIYAAVTVRVLKLKRGRGREAA